MSFESYTCTYHIHKSNKLFDFCCILQVKHQYQYNSNALADNIVYNKQFDKALNINEIEKTYSKNHSGFDLVLSDLN